MNGLAFLQQAYGDRLAAARAAHAAGTPVVGYVGNTVPVELITATGCFAVRIAPVAGDAHRADAHVESFSDLDTRLIFAAYCEGAYDCLRLLIVPRSTEPLHKLYLSLREAQRIGLVKSGPELWLYDILHTQRDSSHAYGLARTGELLDKLASIGGTRPDKAALTDAVALSNQTRLLLQLLQQRRAAHAISGREAHQATGALHFLAPQQGQAALREWLAADTHTPALGPRLLVTGCPLDHDALHARVEQSGARIVLEDDDWGSRAAAPLVAIGRPPLQALFEHAWRDRPCPRLHPAPLAQSWLAQALQQPVFDAVLFNLPQPEDSYGWRFPAARDLVQRAGLPWLLLRRDARTATDLPATLCAFIATLPATA